jgi:translation initiation factor IF-1
MGAKAAVLQATVVAELPQRLYRLEAEDGTTLIAGESPQTQRLGQAFKAGDRVRVRRAPYDPGRGTILGTIPGSAL